jgi:hypothetical protein
MSLLTLIQRACRQLNLPAPTGVIGNADAQVLQLLELAQGAGDDLMRRHAWNALLTRDEFNQSLRRRRLGTRRPTSTASPASSGCGMWRAAGR